ADSPSSAELPADLNMTAAAGPALATVATSVSETTCSPSIQTSRVPSEPSRCSAISKNIHWVVGMVCSVTTVGVLIVGPIRNLVVLGSNPTWKIDWPNPFKTDNHGLPQAVR